MKRTFLTSFLIITSLALLSGATSFSQAISTTSEKPKRYIIKFDSQIKAQDESNVKVKGGKILKKLNLINSIVVVADSVAIRKIKTGLKVVRVEEDTLVHIVKKPPNPKKPGSQLPQEVPWGVDRIDADLAWPVSQGTAVKVAIIDTGIDENHPDLTNNLKGGINFVPQGRKGVDSSKWDDDNGHGTHVGGIVAAEDNNIGVIGVAPQAYLYGVKVLDRRGNGYVSNVIAGIDWSVDNNMDVINMSLGTDNDIQSFHEAVDRAYQNGILVVAAAGNDGDISPDSDVDFPAAYSSVVAVAATDSGDNRAAWSSDGPQLELAAPGINIKSTWKNGGYKDLSGTSMAAPHVAGTGALVLATQPGLSPVEVRAILDSNAFDLGIAGFDSYYGYGLVDAEESISGAQTNP